LLSIEESFLERIEEAIIPEAYAAKTSAFNVPKVRRYHHFTHRVRAVDVLQQQKGLVNTFQYYQRWRENIAGCKNIM
jgi:hypothetical protein